MPDDAWNCTHLTFGCLAATFFLAIAILYVTGAIQSITGHAAVAHRVQLASSFLGAGFNVVVGADILSRLRMR